MILNNTRKVSLCITTYNRCELTLKCFADVLNDSWVDDIIIVDDCSEIEIYNKLSEAVKDMPKVKIYRNDINIDCYANKAKAVSLATNEYVILMDSDNTITKDYISKIYGQMWMEDTILAPVMAFPIFDYRLFSGLYINRQNVSEFMELPMFATALNTCNYFFHRDTYLKCFDPTIDPHSSDSIFMNLQWLKNEGRIYFVPELIYDHLVHDQSHYKANCHKSPEFYQKIEQELINMK